jgi:hypothetical protein
VRFPPDGRFPLPVTLFSYVAVPVISVIQFVLRQPNIHNIKGGVDFLFAYGSNDSEIRFVHPRTGRQIAFRLHMVGGVKQLYFLVDRLLLNPEEHTALLQILDQRGLKLQARRNRAKSEFVNVGHSPELANELAWQVATEIKRWTRFTRLRYEDNFMLAWAMKRMQSGR